MCAGIRRRGGKLAAMAAARGQGILDAADRLAELVPIEETLAA
jgi:hypothetical protein